MQLPKPSKLPKFLLIASAAIATVTWAAEDTVDPIEKLVLEAESANQIKETVTPMNVKPASVPNAAKAANPKTATTTPTKSDGTQAFPLGEAPKVEHTTKPIEVVQEPLQEQVQKAEQTTTEPAPFSDPEADQVLLKPSDKSVADIDVTGGLGKLCDDGNAQACLRLSNNYLYGMDIGQDLSKAKEYADKACQLGNGDGCSKVGFFLRRGLGAPMNAEEAKDYLAKACELGTSSGCNDLAEMYMNGLGLEQSPEQAKKYYEIACRQNNVAACRSLETNFGIAKEDLKAVPEPAVQPPVQMASNISAAELAGASTEGAELSIVQACDMKSGEACSQLSNAFLTGQGQEQSNEKAFLMAQKACDLNFALGCYQLGYMYREGIGTTKSGSKMKKLYEKGCLLGAPQICSALGHEYYLGEKIRLSYEDALKYYGEACDMDDEDACKAYATIVKQLK